MWVVHLILKKTTRHYPKQNCPTALSIEVAPFCLLRGAKRFLAVSLKVNVGLHTGKQVAHMNFPF
jgi:hypothetical protein